MSTATLVAPAAPPGIPSEFAAYLEALIDHAVDRLGDRITAALEAEGERLPMELRLWTAEQLAKEWSLTPGWFTDRAGKRQGPATKPGAGHPVRWSVDDIAELIKQGRIGPRGRQLPRAA